MAESNQIPRNIAATGPPTLVEPAAEQFDVHPMRGDGHAVAEMAQTFVPADGADVTPGPSVDAESVRPVSPSKAHDPYAAATRSLLAAGGVIVGVAAVVVASIAFSKSHISNDSHVDFGISRLQDGLSTRHLVAVPQASPHAAFKAAVHVSLNGHVSGRPTMSTDDPLTRRVSRVWADESDPTRPERSPPAAETRSTRACRYADVTACIAQCEAGHSASCHRFAEDALYGPVERRNTDRGVELLVELCVNGRVDSCVLLGTWLESLVPPSDPDGPALAHHMWEYLCTEGVGMACWRRATLLKRDGDRGDMTAVFRALDRGCRLGVAQSCLDVARHAQGTPPRAEPRTVSGHTSYRETARLMATLGCTVSKNPADCVTLAHVVKDTQGSVSARRYLDQARALLTGPCDQSDVEACHHLGLTFLEPGESPSRAVSILERACIGGVARSCHALADVLVRSSSGPANASHGAQMYERGCRLGEGRSCLALAEMMERGTGGSADMASTDRYRTLAQALGTRSLSAIDSP